MISPLVTLGETNMISPLAILAAAAAQPARARVYVDEANFAKLCARPDAQRYIVNGSAHGVIVDGVTYRHADSLPVPDFDGGDL